MSPNHWTLLQGDRASPDEPWFLTYRDSLHPPSENALKQARTVAALLGVLLFCDHEYLFRYLMRKEALKRSKVPLATGQEAP